LANHRKNAEYERANYNTKNTSIDAETSDSSSVNP
jgi:hypothetical protein